ncbi:MAG: hypothetical protein DRP95_05945 [Candidatus Latescibacterota bacterium]|nr:MAG: hypothetical protein DRP95_05945 [Candidatus Latescibacterota bacterium]
MCFPRTSWPCGRRCRSSECTEMRRGELYRLARQVAEVLKDDYHVKRVFLIGSVAKGRIHDGSDIDIVVEGLAPELYIRALAQIYDILPPGVELNLIPFEDAFESLREKTLREGIVLYGGTPGRN